MIFRFHKVTDGLYRGSAPSPEDLAYLKKKYNIKKVVSLDEIAGNRIKKAAKDLNIKQIIIPIDYRNNSILKLFQYNLRHLLLDNGPTFVHCATGKDRTGLAVALLKCKFFGKDPEDALKEAEKIGLGLGLKPETKKLYRKLILSCKSKDNDKNNADIVSNQREEAGDKRDSVLYETHMKSIVPFLDTTKPHDLVYNNINYQSDTREEYFNKCKPSNKIEDEDSYKPPLVGLYNSDAGYIGFGPVISPGGFIYE